MQKYKSLSLTGKGQTAAMRRCPRFFRDRKRQSDHFAAAGYPTRRPKAAHGNERCGGFAPPSPALCATAKRRRAQLVARNDCTRYYTMPAAVCQPRGFILRRVGSFCPRRVRRPSLRRTLFCGNSALGGGASRRRRAAFSILRPPRRVRRPAPSLHTRRPFAAAARACRARRSFPLPAR